jgi:hypothetical protein
MQLIRTELSSVDLSAEAQVLSYTYTGTAPLEVIARVNLGDDVHGLSGGGGVYTLNFYIGGVLITPSSQVQVSSGVLKTIVISRPIPIAQGDVISIKVVGRPADTNVNTLSALRDVTAAKVEDLLGDGSTEVDHDTGGTDNMMYETSGGSGIAGAQITIYLKSDYDTRNRGNEFVVARTSTGSDGKWARSVMLLPGTYTAVFYKANEYGPDKREFTI